MLEYRRRVLTPYEVAILPCSFGLWWHGPSRSLVLLGVAQGYVSATSP